MNIESISTKIYLSLKGEGQLAQMDAVHFLTCVQIDVIIKTITEND